MQVEYWHPVSSTGLGRYAARCSNANCETRTMSFSVDEYPFVNISVHIELYTAEMERFRLGYVTPRLEAARRAIVQEIAERKSKVRSQQASA
jgi:hypothetical protein